jgi:glutathione S-transferase
MSDTAQRLVLYGAPASQPSRAVYWTCLQKGLPFELRLPDFASSPDPEESELARLNPKGQVPTIVDGDFSLYEMPAILVYLCEKHDWEDLYPRDLEQRAFVNQYLHFHHGSTRLATMKLMAPHVTVAFRELMADRGRVLKDMQNESLQVVLSEPDVLAAGREVVETVAGMIEAGYLRNDSRFLCGNAATIADIACYEELAQLRWAGLFDFAGFPKLQRWLEEMAKLPYHEEAHRYNTALGDILSEPNTMQRFLEASQIGQAALEELGARVV